MLVCEVTLQIVLLEGHEGTLPAEEDVWVIISRSRIVDLNDDRLEIGVNRFDRF